MSKIQKAPQPDPARPGHLFAGFFMPGIVLTSTDGGKTWQTLTD